MVQNALSPSVSIKSNAEEIMPVMCCNGFSPRGKCHRCFQRKCLARFRDLNSNTIFHINTQEFQPRPRHRLDCFFRSIAPNCVCHQLQFPSRTFTGTSSAYENCAHCCNNLLVISANSRTNDNHLTEITTNQTRKKEDIF